MSAYRRDLVPAVVNGLATARPPLDHDALSDTLALLLCSYDVYTELLLNLAVNYRCGGHAFAAKGCATPIPYT